MFERENLMAQLGDGYTNRLVDRLHRFAVLPRAILESLATDALNEEWGQNLFALRKYLAVHIPWSIEQGRFTTSRNQLYVTAGHLQTRYGTPLYLVFEENHEGDPPYWLATAGASISAPELPAPPLIPNSPDIAPGSEIVMLHDHILGENADRVRFLAGTPKVAQMCAVAGAIQWSINRGLQIPQWYFGRMQYLIPLYLQSRENIALAPDVIAPVQVNERTLLVRTVLEPAMPYAGARVAVHRHDQLPNWLLDAWRQYSSEATEEAIEDPGAEESGEEFDSMAAAVTV